MWDNRATKKNPKAPDFKCKNRSCDGVVWPPPVQQQAAPARAPQAAAPRPMTPVDVMDSVVARYTVALAQAFAIVPDAFDERKAPYTSADVLSCAATLFIEYNRRERGG